MATPELDTFILFGRALIGLANLALQHEPTTLWGTLLFVDYPVMGCDVWPHNRQLAGRVSAVHA
jgi:hypothetical protein